MKSLLKKMKKQVDHTEPSDAQHNLNCEHLKEIFEDHHLTMDKYKGFYEDLLTWKKQI